MPGSRKGSCPGKTVCGRVREWMGCGGGGQGETGREHPPPRGGKDVFSTVGLKEWLMHDYGGGPWPSAQYLPRVFILKV